MIAALAVAFLGLVLLALQGAVATVLPRSLVPDFAPLVAIALALQLGGARGLVGSALVGIAADTLSGAPYGHLTALTVLPYLGARAANASLELRSRAAQAALAAVWTPIAAVLSLAVFREGGAAAALSPGMWVAVAIQTGVAAALAPVVGALVERVVALTWVDDAGRRGAPISVQRAVQRRAG